MQPPDRVEQLITVALLTGIVLGVGVWINHLRNNKASHGFRRGERVLSWVVSGCFVGGLIGMFIADEQNHFFAEVSPALGGVGMLLGVIVGNVRASRIPIDDRHNSQDVV